MLNTSLITTLRTFSPEDLNRFGEFLKSPFFNKKKTALRLFEYAAKFAPDFSSEKLDRKKVWKSLFGDKEFNYGVMKNVIHDLGKLADKYFAVCHYEKDAFLQSANLMREQLSRGLYQAFEKNMRSAKSRIARSGMDRTYFGNVLQLEMLEETFLSQEFNTRFLKQERSVNVAESLTMHYTASIAERYYNHLLNTQYSVKEKEDANVHSFLQYISGNTSLNKELVNFYTSYIKTVLEPFNEKNYNDFKDNSEGLYEKFSENLKNRIFLAQVNFCNNMVMNGKQNYNRELFLVMKKYFGGRTFSGTGNDYLNQYNYAIAVSSACNEGEFEWAENFIEEYRNKLRPESREQFYLYARITLCMKRRDYNTALDLLSSVKQNNVMDKITVKRYQLMIYYESGYATELYSMIDTFSSFKNKNQDISESVRELIGYFIYFMKNIAELKFGKVRQKDRSFLIEKLSDEIKLNKVVNRSWLIDKLNELRKV